MQGLNFVGISCNELCARTASASAAASLVVFVKRPASVLPSCKQSGTACGCDLAACQCDLAACLCDVGV